MWDTLFLYSSGLHFCRGVLLTLGCRSVCCIKRLLLSLCADKDWFHGLFFEGRYVDGGCWIGQLTEAAELHN